VAWGASATVANVGGSVAFRRRRERLGFQGRERPVLTTGAVQMWAVDFRLVSRVAPGRSTDGLNKYKGRQKGSVGPARGENRGLPGLGGAPAPAS